MSEKLFITYTFESDEPYSAEDLVGLREKLNEAAADYDGGFIDDSENLTIVNAAERERVENSKIQEAARDLLTDGSVTAQIVILDPVENEVASFEMVSIEDEDGN